MKAQMTRLMIKISTKLCPSLTKWRHQNILETPYLDYDFGSEGFWSATDRRVSGKATAIAKFHNTYWEQTTPQPQGYEQVNLFLYEDELELEIQRAIERVNSRWQEKFKTDFENHFEDDLVKFINS